ncbi:hypothetical protein GQ43DRAFT_311980 [Delitschia confertaspora ATCC 74209]|uniref:AhpC/TSA antioxidant enzyme-domain-containing protein n=1 Tax=Delitschia confertaspora ATCC 74209 TaxID=1513339 RepID=A0A9P4JSH6_9PLEO|nr:hypothetical protein GQ43DRAFT_311980 [Delitschia confertaspora ATCC 74209]
MAEPVLSKPSSVTAEPNTISTASETAPPSNPMATNTKASVVEPGPKDVTSTNELPSPILSPNGATPVLEKSEIDFVGDVEVNNDLPTDKQMKAVEDLLVLDAKGQSRPFKQLYAGEGVAPRQLIIFIRHFFCGNCQEYLRTLSSSITPDELLSLPTPTFISVIGCGSPDLIEMYQQTTSCPFPIYADPTRKLYDYLGMTRTLTLGKKPEYMQTGLLSSSIQSIIQGIKQGRNAMSGGDFKQVGGEFMFEEGECFWVHRMRNTRDHAEIPELRKVLGLGDEKTPVRKRWSHGIREVRKRSGSWGRGSSRSRKEGKEGKASKEGSIREEPLGEKEAPTS